MLGDPAIEEESNIVEDNKTANAISSMLWCWKYVNREAISLVSLNASFASTLTSILPTSQALTAPLTPPLTSDSVAIEQGDGTLIPVGAFLKPGGPVVSSTQVTFRFYAYDSRFDGDIERENTRLLAAKPLPIPNGFASIEATFDSLDAAEKAVQKELELETQFRANGLDSYLQRDISIIGLPKTSAIISTDSPILMFGNKDVFFLSSKPPQYYLRFGALLKYIRDELLPKIDTKKPSHYDNPPIFDINISQYTNFMYSLPNQISLDPKVCIVRNNKFQKISSTVQVFTNLDGFLVEDFSSATTLKNQAHTMNIYLNFEFILESLTSNTDERGDISVYNFLKVVCDGLNKALGGINNLEPTVNEETNILSIIDTTPIPGRIKNGSYFLQLYGYKGIQSTFVRKVDLKTAITPEYATMITIGATAGGYVKGTEATAFSRWNSGLTDRFQEKYIPGNENSLPDGGLDEAVTNYTTEMLSKVSLCYGFTGDLSGINGTSPELGELSEDAISTNLSVGTEYYKYLISSNKNQQGGTVGFIPFKISFTMDGISGIKIYNVLHVDTRFLPKAYGDNVNLIVTGVTHKLSDNDWQTDIEATVMPKTSNLSSLVIDPSVIAEQIKKAAPGAEQAKVIVSAFKKIVNAVTRGGTGPKRLGTYGTAGPNGPVSPDALTLAAIDQIVTDSGTSNDLRKRIIKIAASYVGQYELPPPPPKDGKWNEGWYDPRFETKMLDLKNPWQEGQPWCNWFTNLCWTEAYTTGNALVPSTTSYQSIWNTKLGGGAYGKPLTPGVSATFDGFRKLGQTITKSQAKSGTKLPEPGDMVMFRYPDGNHIEIVVATKVTNGKLTGLSTIGGNTSANNDDRDGGATKYKPNVGLGSVTGFGKVIF